MHPAAGSHAEPVDASGAAMHRRRALTVAAAAMASARAGLTQTPAVPMPANPRSRALLALVERCTFGVTVEEWERAQALGHAGYLEYHLNPDAIDDAALDVRLAPLVTLWMTPQQTVDNAWANHPVQELKFARILRAAFSKRQLFERMVEFWTDHFSIYIKDGSVRQLKPTDDRDVVRAHALGRFPDLLNASARSAAMLLHLDNHENLQSGPNENYARELMELHTLGVDGGYTETDVKEAARCLTGWSFLPLGSGQFGTFAFFGGDHDAGTKQVLGHTFPAGQGKKDAEELVNLLGSHPSTARFVGRKLARWLLHYDPSDALVDAVAASWQATGGDIKAAVRLILGEEWLAASEPWKHRKLRRPLHFAIALLRGLDADIEFPASLLSPAPLTLELRRLGQEPFDWPSPNGYPDTEVAWGSALLPRWSFASRVLRSEVDGVVLDRDAIIGRLEVLAKKTGSIGAALDVLLTGGSFSDEERRRLDVYAARMPHVGWSRIQELLALAASSPSYQRY